MRALSLTTVGTWPTNSREDVVRSIRCLSSLKTSFPFMNDAVPKYRGRIIDLPVSIATTLVANHPEPYAWWYGQIMGYIFRLQDSFRRRIENFKREIGYEHPIVSLHIRRTDKKSEATYHEVTDYMKHAEEFYRALALRGKAVEKRVFVATDEPSILYEIKCK
ncbi:hypothetical protein MTO96_033955 [Rhipicephalus appendiculatus]